MRIVMILAIALLGFVPACAADAPAPENYPVTLKKQQGKLAIHIGDRPFGTYIHEGYKKPFFQDLRAPNGPIVTRSLSEEAIDDHDHHKGLWLAIDEVNGLKHWAERHRIRTKSVNALLKKSGDADGFRVENEWLDADGNPVLSETSTISISPDRLIAYDIQLTPAGDEAVEFGDTKEGFFAIRLANALRADQGSGTIVNSNGQTGEPEAWGKKADWVDYSGAIDGEPVGVAIFDHPANPRPGRYHVRRYGLFAINPFGRSAYTKGELEPNPIRLKPGETLRLRYAAWIHAGDAQQAGVAQRYQRYLKAMIAPPASQ